MSKIQVGDMARDPLGVLWECTVRDIGERYSVGVVRRSFRVPAEEIRWISLSDWRKLDRVSDPSFLEGTSVTREVDVGDLTGLIGRRHLERCDDCGRYKYLVEVCPHCNEALIDTGVGRQVQSVIEHQAAALCFVQLTEGKT